MNDEVTIDRDRLFDSIVYCNYVYINSLLKDGANIVVTNINIKDDKHKYLLHVLQPLSWISGKDITFKCSLLQRARIKKYFHKKLDVRKAPKNIGDDTVLDFPTLISELERQIAKLVPTKGYLIKSTEVLPEIYHAFYEDKH